MSNNSCVIRENGETRKSPLLRRPAASYPARSSVNLVDSEATQQPKTKKSREDIKERFRQLYLGENLRLKDVMEILSMEDEFVATKKMFKSGITQWKFEKNYRATDKAQIAFIIKSFKDNG